MNNKMTHWHILTRIHLIFFMFSIMMAATPSYSQEESAVALLTGRKASGMTGNVYLLPGLQQGQRLFVHVEGTSGNFDPLIGLAGTDFNLPTLVKRFTTETGRADTAGDGPLKAVDQLAKEFLLVWDDDSGEGYAAAFEWRVPLSGNYKLLVTSTPARATFGDYQLLVGLDAPQVLSGKADPFGRLDIALDAASPMRVLVEEVSGTLTADQSSTRFELDDVRAQDTLYAWVQATSGDLAPILRLEDFSGKPPRPDHISRQEKDVALKYTMIPKAGNYRLHIGGCCEEGARTENDYRLLVGINAPEVVTGKAAPTGSPVIKKPIEVRVGIKLQQITGVDQKAENFGVVADLRLEWTDPKLAFDPQTCQCDSRLFTVDSFIKFVQEQGIKWPAFNIFNQQGRSWFQSQIVTIYPDGRIIYEERFSATLQAPDFDFRKFPFDTQQFHIHVISALPDESFTYAVLEDFSAFGEKLGEEEWITEEFATTISRQDDRSVFSFSFKAHRHLTYYIGRNQSSAG